MSMKIELAVRIADEVSRVYGGEATGQPPDPARHGLPLTKMQRDVLDTIIEYRAEHGMSPTMVELATALFVGKVTVFEHVEQLERKGWIRRQKYYSRSIEVIDGRTRHGTGRLLELVRQYAAAV